VRHGLVGERMHRHVAARARSVDERLAAADEVAQALAPVAGHRGIVSARRRGTWCQNHALALDSGRAAGMLRVR
jgi:hypothetical protein